MNFKPPLQILMFSLDSDAEVRPYETAIERIFLGGAAAAGYVATGEDLGIEFRRFRALPSLPSSIDELMDAACHTIILVIRGDEAFPGELEDYIVSAANHARSKPNHSVVELYLSAAP